MRLAVGLGIAFAACGCAGGPRASHARAAVDDPMPTRATPIVERFQEVVSWDEHITPPAEHAPSRSLGFIGDQPIGVLPDPPHVEPAWTRPFPCHWTRTCGMVPLLPCYPAYVGAYPGD